MEQELPSLFELCRCSIAIQLFKINVRWRRLTDVAFSLRDIIEEMRLSLKISLVVREALAQALKEVKRWDGKHSEMFLNDAKKRAMSKNEHLRTFYEHLVWKRYKIEIDDVATARYLIKVECRNWPLMQFQFACLYAEVEMLNDDFRFDKYRRATFKKQLSDHPAYDFWLTLMESRHELFFETERRLPNQKLTQCLIFAIRNGFMQLMEFIWTRIGDRHRESVGLLELRAMLFRARDGQTMRFLCEELCRMNPVGVSRIAWTAFFDTFHRMLHEEKSDVVVQNQFKNKFEFLLRNSCPTLKNRLLKMENYRLICDAFRYNLTETFAMMLEAMSPEEVATAREYVDRIFDRRKTRQGERLRRAMMRRQCTFS
ncbi:unnamed protein product [Caenorhabditis auriculariae]|uniref:Uncharacterized protein n=1 Tax=Caenorhabditis auriculariae TaxID=2777116 RepID=A0A8S1HW90_9PELO|nr:unnamed protein product [Caenorhabditis auriculariae]